MYHTVRVSVWSFNKSKRKRPTSCFYNVCHECITPPGKVLPDSLRVSADVQRGVISQVCVTRALCITLLGQVLGGPEEERESRLLGTL